MSSHPPPAAIRPMHRADLAFAASLTAAENWASENLLTFEGFFEHDPAGCLLAELDGKPVGICVATPYESSGFIGELIVRPEARGHGVGAHLLNTAVKYLQSRGAATVYLDGVLRAVPLYERNGFRRICRSLRFSGEVRPYPSPQVRPMEAADLPEVVALDQRMFGANRGYFITRRFQLYPHLCKVLVENSHVSGYITGRQVEGWVSLGPWVVTEQAADPSQLLAAAANGQPVGTGILESNPRAVELVKSLGLTERAECPIRMALGPESNLGTSVYCYSVGSAAKG